MKPKPKQAWRWIVAGWVVVLLVCCGIWATHSHHPGNSAENAGDFWFFGFQLRALDFQGSKQP